MQLTCYHPSNSSLWQGRNDGLPNERMFQIVKCIDIQKKDALTKSTGNNAIALIGFSSDEGVVRNLGRAGAAEGPYEFKKYFANLAVSEPSNLQLFDLGTIRCSNKKLEEAQEELARVVELAISKKYMPLVIGGGHEVSFGGYLGASRALQANIAVINFDAHLDLRPVGEAGSTSGNSFTKIAEYCAHEKFKFEYMVIGFEQAANTASLVAKSYEYKTQLISAHEMHVYDLDHNQVKLDAFIDRCSHIYLTICMDVFAQSYAPGVSAPQPLGLLPHHVVYFLKRIISSGKVVCVDIAEYAPPLDSEGKTGKLCAYIAQNVITWF